ncbi:COG1180: Radical SAM, Pyruvate-formate lyase-activating enzyme like [hydrothermal vent metagenome]|uniref:COG1180: Radical SAM, Pyruvate-formate lyase-activating enzyme like n=1 Tax=hydrothermal vent metagenome TaxID=652676 RepID=A0A1W1BJX0_9ZZZZ
MCLHYCTLKEGKTGICGVNTNQDKQLVNLTYNHPSALHLDPIEKKPLYHFLPTSKSLSLGTVGCNFRCPFCQNWSISQTSNINTNISYTPKQIVELALVHQAKSISYTYNEPTIWYPYAKDIGILAKEVGLKNVFVSSGYESREVFEDMLNWVDAINVDLKSFSPSYYKKVLKTSLDGVLENLKKFATSSIWMEVTTLVIPGVNDSKEELKEMAHFIAKEIGKETIWHLSAFHPDYKMQDTPPTPLHTLLMAKEIAKEAGLEYVYLGNVLYDSATYCKKCGEILIQREGYDTKIRGLDVQKGECKKCQTKIQGVWK